MPAADFRNLNDSALLDQCRLETFRGSGPGGQKRNKTSNMVRLTHPPTGITVIAGESRSQAENKTRALRRLKMQLALEIRRPIDPRGWEPPAWVGQVVARPSKSASMNPSGGGTRLQISHRHRVYFALVGLSLDLLESLDGGVADVAALLGISTSSLVKFFGDDPHFWMAVNKIRAKHKLPALKPR